jgi:hypothetical protein
MIKQVNCLLNILAIYTAVYVSSTESLSILEALKTDELCQEGE